MLSLPYHKNINKLCLQILQITVNPSTQVKELDFFRKRKKNPTPCFLNQCATENPASFLCLSIKCSFSKLPALSQFDIQTLFDIWWLWLAPGG